jgi:acetyl esterase/lipase
MKLFLPILAAMFLSSAASAHQTNAIPLWPEGPPGSLGTAEKDIPTLTPYFPESTNARTGAALVICPGGGYGGLAALEGDHYARFFNESGITCFVLKYRLGSAGYRHPIELHDAMRAVRIVRSRAGEWGLDPNRIGIVGSSAGGHLASTLLTHFEAGSPNATNEVERVSSRPDLGILCYPVITMGEFTHEGSKKNLLGTNPSEDLVRELSNELHVAAETPPCFIFHTAEDKAVPVENSLKFVSALRAAGVPFDFHVYERGGHGLGLGSREWNPSLRHPWTRDVIFWLKLHKFAQ